MGSVVTAASMATDFYQRSDRLAMCTSLIDAAQQTPRFAVAMFVPGCCDRAGGWGRPVIPCRMRCDPGSQHTVERVAFERIAELKIHVEHGVALVAAELLEPGRVDAAIHAGAQRAALEAVPAHGGGIEAGVGGAGLDDAGNGAGIDGGIDG